MISAIGLMVPSTFDMWVTATILVLGPRSSAKASMSSEPSSLIGAHFSTAPLRSRSRCHGTMLEWCSISVTMISSPGSMLRPMPLATRLIASVPPLVQTMFSPEGAFRKRATISRAASNASVASFDRVCRPRWTLA
ncbi:hypothetical protein D3C85_1550110 [compost metagenome]